MGWSNHHWKHHLHTSFKCWEHCHDLWWWLFQLYPNSNHCCVAELAREPLLQTTRSCLHFTRTWFWWLAQNPTHQEPFQHHSQWMVLGTCYANFNKLYTAPYFATTILVIDSTTNATAFLSFTSTSVSGRWSGIALAHNGKMFTSPPFAPSPSVSSHRIILPPLTFPHHSEHSKILSGQFLTGTLCVLLHGLVSIAIGFFFSLFPSSSLISRGSSEYHLSLPKSEKAPGWRTGPWTWGNQVWHQSCSVLINALCPPSAEMQTQLDPTQSNYWTQPTQWLNSINSTNPTTQPHPILPHLVLLTALYFAAGSFFQLRNRGRKDRNRAKAKCCYQRIHRII